MRVKELIPANIRWATTSNGIEVEMAKAANEEIANEDYTGMPMTKPIPNIENNTLTMVLPPCQSCWATDALGVRFKPCQNFCSDRPEATKNPNGMHE